MPCKSDVRRVACRILGHRGFTLIELLVVVAILALLMAILLPSLGRARTLTKITICKVNAKQIATMVNCYQTDYRDRVPIVFNYYGNGHGEYDLPARACWLSVALRMYHSGRSLLSPGGRFDPEQCWYPETGKLAEYEAKYLQEFWVCPFQRGEGTGRVLTSQDKFFKYYEWQGKHELYQTWAWENLVPEQPGQFSWPGGAGPTRRGLVKYRALSWNAVATNSDPLWHTASQGKYPKAAYAGSLHRSWGQADLRRLGSRSPSSLTTTFCAQGEHNVYIKNQNLFSRCNVRSHPQGSVGGTTATFADSHVEWVLGSRIGWP